MLIMMDIQFYSGKSTNPTEEDPVQLSSIAGRLLKKNKENILLLFKLDNHTPWGKFYSKFVIFASPT